MSRLHVALMRDSRWRADHEGLDAASSTADGLAFSNEAMPDIQDLHDRTTMAASAAIVRVLGRERSQWRRTLDDVKSALVSLERASDAAGALQTSDIATEVSDLVNGLVTAATEASLAAADRARAEARSTIEELEARLARLEADSLNKLTVATARQQEEQTLRLRAEAAWADAQRVHEQVVAAYHAQLQAARLRAENERLQFAALRQQLTASIETASARFGRTMRASIPTSGCAPTRRRLRKSRPDRTGEQETSLNRAIEAPTKPTREFTVVPSAPALVAAPEMVEFMSLLLKEAEATYGAEIATRPPLEVVARLTDNLRAAAAQVAARIGAREDDAAVLFKDHLMGLLNARSETSFGRHLSISVRELYPIGSRIADPAQRVA